MSCHSGAMVNIPQQRQAWLSLPTLCTSIIRGCDAQSRFQPSRQNGRSSFREGVREGAPPLPSPPQAPPSTLTCLLCPHGAEPIPRSAWGRSARSDSSESADGPGRPLTGWPRASCHSCPHNTAGRRKRRRKHYCLHLLPCCVQQSHCPAAAAAGSTNRESQQATHSVVLTAGLPPKRIAAIWVVLLFCLRGT